MSQLLATSPAKINWNLSRFLTKVRRFNSAISPCIGSTHGMPLNNGFLPSGERVDVSVMSMEGMAMHSTLDVRKIRWKLMRLTTTSVESCQRTKGCRCATLIIRLRAHCYFLELNLIDVTPWLEGTIQGVDLLTTLNRKRDIDRFLITRTPDTDTLGMIERGAVEVSSRFEFDMNLMIMTRICLHIELDRCCSLASASRQANHLSSHTMCS